MSRRTNRSRTALLVAGAFAGLLSSHPLPAQPLSPALCPPGSPFNLRPEGFAPAIAGAPDNLARHTLDVASYPDAICNDGSPAVAYLRPASPQCAAQPQRPECRRWILYFDGGGGCRDASDCLDTRWCSGGGRVFDRAGKMSSRGAWPAIRSLGGLFRRNPPPPLANAFAGFNVVVAHYCSSDNWIGSADLAGIATSGGVSYDIHFQGEAIVDALLDTLLAGPVAPDVASAPFCEGCALPDLDHAELVLVAGVSAGGGGVRHHLDRLRDELVARIPKVEVRGIVDAGVPPALDRPALDWSDPYSPGDYAHHLATTVEPVVRSFWGAADTALDASCLDPAWTADHELVGTHPQVCYDTTYTLLQHVTTPVFVRQDIDDFLGKQRYVDWSLYPSNDEFWAEQFDQLSTHAGYSPAAGGLEAPDAAPGIYGPNCGLHVALTADPGFFRHRVTVAGAPVAETYHDLLRNWVFGGGGATQSLQVDTAGFGVYSPSFCP
ncbi:MAG: hypothetical protein AMXMBFR36_00670 [Acidobacteriota bacterium]